MSNFWALWLLAAYGALSIIEDVLRALY